MKKLHWLRAFVFTMVASWTSWAAAQNQTATLTPVVPYNGTPFRVQIETAFQLPVGVQSFVVGSYQGKWLLLAGRVNGLHGFDNSDTNFPANTQNNSVFVIDPKKQTVVSRLLTDEESGLTQAQIDLLTVTGAQFYQSGKRLYMCGGYGVDTANSTFSTKAALTAIDIQGLMHWVTNPKRGETAAEHIRSVFNPIFQVSGGSMMEATPGHVLLAFGAEFEGPVTPSSSGTYSAQVRRFLLNDNGKQLAYLPLFPMPSNPDPNYARTNVNVVPTIVHGDEAYTAFAGVFTPGFGVWTVPVEISALGTPSMADPVASNTFKQAMNHWACPSLQLYSRKDDTAYTVLMGGISYGYFDDEDTFQTDSELPFFNQVTTIKRDPNGVYSQFLMDDEYPVILSTGSNPGNQLLFGAGAAFLPAKGLGTYSNGVMKLDGLKKKPVVVGYIVGGIQSTLPNTNTSSDTAASPYVFKVTLAPNLR